VSGSLRDKAANRAGQYRSTIAAMQADGDFRAGLHEAERWLLSELNRVQRQRPQDAAAVYVEVTAKLSALAEVLPFYKPERKGATGEAS
jgi:hypothetical protein